MKNDHLFSYILQLADNALILGHRLSEWCGHAPILEIDMAITNIALDLVGQSRSLYQYAAEVQGEGKSEDDLAYLRDVTAFRNVLLVELPKEDFAHTIMRQFLYDAFNHPYYTALQRSKDERLSAIAEKSLKEITYHLRYSSEWVIRLGDGTEESHQKMQVALDNLWMYTGELLEPSPAEQAMAAAEIAPDLETIGPLVREKMKEIIDRATLRLPQEQWMQNGGKTGRHTEHLGHALAEMQFLQRAYPGAEW